MPRMPPIAVEVSEQLLAWLVKRLRQAGGRLLARLAFQAVRRRRRQRIVQNEKAAAVNPARPSGPFVTVGSRCDLLIFVPRRLDSYLIDELTGAYGYSHVTVDCGEVDLPTGRRVMTESMVREVVQRSFQDRYGRRAFVRIPLGDAGVDRSRFCGCVHSELGEAYDVWEALTWAEVDDPVRQICSGLASGCLPASVLAGIVHMHRRGRLRRHSVSVHPHRRRPANVFVSPNGLAEYFGAPPGHSLTGPDQLVQPRVRSRGAGRAARRATRPVRRLLLAGLLAAAGVWLVRSRMSEHRAIRSAG